jgi:hypothetical protein
VTEAEWTQCRKWKSLFGLFTEGLSGRKLHLFACACCRRIWHLLHEGSRKVVELAEGQADGSVEAERVRVAIEASQRVQLDPVATNAVAAVCWFTDKDFARGVSMVTGNAACCVAMKKVPGWRTAKWEAVKEEEEAQQAEVFREITANPFHPPPPLPSSVLTWNGGTVPHLAQGIYAERAFDRLPILADALEDAGCHDAGILAHCRGPGPHVRGCWVVDLLLGKT